ncbi:hypothetical protein K7X08_008915 [Anisodus acutangulus]|uniref:Glycosyl hydrolase family 95 N-terminal domain-containing protein n=1 Tax=Anisodus acutangulus TaxID=402998 RepID=A0A9Q1RT02_9SOLA|nr:hypothetical protein K7X08_008915 [Anisodus acutangulus]
MHSFNWFLIILFCFGDVKLEINDSFLIGDFILMKVYQLLGDIKLEFDDSQETLQEEKYERVLDLDTATMKVNYSMGDAEFAREYFASNPDQVIAAKVSAYKSGCLAFTLSMDSKMHHHTCVSGNNKITMEGSCPGKRKTPKADANDNPKGIQFAAILDLQINEGSACEPARHMELHVRATMGLCPSLEYQSSNELLACTLVQS